MVTSFHSVVEQQWWSFRHPKQSQKFSREIVLALWSYSKLIIYWQWICLRHRWEMTVLSESNHLPAPLFSAENRSHPNTFHFLKSKFNFFYHFRFVSCFFFFHFVKPTVFKTTVCKYSGNASLSQTSSVCWWSISTPNHNVAKNNDTPTNWSFFSESSWTMKFFSLKKCIELIFYD